MSAFKAIRKMSHSPLVYMYWTKSLVHTNHEATQLIRKLYVVQNESFSSTSIDNTIQRAFNVYYDIKHVPDHFVLNALLKLLLRCNAAGHVERIWNDIENASFLRAETASMTYPLWLKCCVQAEQVNIVQCLQMIEWSKKHGNSRIQMSAESLVGLIQKCDSLHSLRSVHALLQEKYLCLSSRAKDQDIYTAVYGHLIVAYSRLGDIRSAVDIAANEMKGNFQIDQLVDQPSYAIV